MSDTIDRMTLICQCNDMEHMLVMDMADELGEEYTVLYVHVHLTAHGFWRRVLWAIRYIFGYKCRFGPWTELIVSPEEARAMMRYLERYLKRVEKGDAGIPDEP